MSTHTKTLYFIAIMMLTWSAYGQEPEQEKKRQHLGWIERVLVLPEKLYYDVKLTPGSSGNVLHAEDIVEFTRDGELWIRFVSPDRKGKNTPIERPVTSKKRFRVTSGKVRERYMVTLGLCISDVYQELEFALENRSKFTYEGRVGREALAGFFVIDPAQSKTASPKCIKQEKKIKGMLTDDSEHQNAKPL